MGLAIYGGDERPENVAGVGWDGEGIGRMLSSDLTVETKEDEVQEA